MTTILITRTVHWDICRHRCFERKDRQIKTASCTELQGQLQSINDMNIFLKSMLFLNYTLQKMESVKRELACYACKLFFR